VQAPAKRLSCPNSHRHFSFCYQIDAMVPWRISAPIAAIGGRVFDRRVTGSHRANVQDSRDFSAALSNHDLRLSADRENPRAARQWQAAARARIP
jgi:hypothetical protein